MNRPHTFTFLEFLSFGRSEGGFSEKCEFIDQLNYVNYNPKIITIKMTEEIINRSSA